MNAVKKIYILGKNSFIARALKKSLADEGHVLIGVSHRDDFLPKFENHSVVINCCAAYAPDDDLNLMMEANFYYPFRLMKLCNETHHIINFSSYFEFGDFGARGPVNNYARAKMLLRSWLQDRHIIDRWRAVSIVLYDVVGQGDHRLKLLPELCSLNKNEKIALTRCEQKIAFTPVENISSLVSFLINSDSSFPLLTVEKPCFKTLREWVELIRKKVEFYPVYGALEYRGSTIFEPQDNFPYIQGLQSLQVDDNYINQLIMTSGRRRDNHC